MPKLFVAGDSFACLCKSQQEGISWSEIVSQELKYELVNLSRPGTSNESICLQIDYISQHVLNNDFVIIFLTDSFRKTLPKCDADLSKKHLLMYHSLHDLQNHKGDNIFEKDALLNVYTHLNASTDESKFYFKNLYNYRFQKYIETTLIAGACAKLKMKTKNFLVFSNGFNDEIYANPVDVTAEMFCISEKNFHDFSSTKILKFAREPNSINHISELGHQKLAKVVINSINKCIAG